jgi:hypothetical protein
MTPDLPGPPAAPAPSPDAPTTGERERVAHTLCLHFASDHLSMDALEERLEGAYRATTRAELERLVADLPALVEPETTPAAGPLPRHGRLWAILAGTARRGVWLVPRRLKVVTVLGSAEIDLREATFAQGVTEIDVTAVLGSVEIVVPPGVRVEGLGTAVLGSFESAARDAALPVRPQPVLRVTGLSVLASVEATVRPTGDAAAGEPPGDRDDARRLRRGRRR